MVNIKCNYQCSDHTYHSLSKLIYFSVFTSHNYIVREFNCIKNGINALKNPSSKHQGMYHFFARKHAFKKAKKYLKEKKTSWVSY